MPSPKLHKIRLIGRLKDALDATTKANADLEIELNRERDRYAEALENARVPEADALGAPAPGVEHDLVAFDLENSPSGKVIDAHKSWQLLGVSPQYSDPYSMF